MKKITALIFLIISTFTTQIAHAHSYEYYRDQARRQKAKVKVEAKSNLFACPMHPEVTDDKSTKCPKCKMRLVLKDKSSVVQEGTRKTQ